MKSYIISNYDALNAIRTEWNRLAGNFSSPLMRHEWFMSCAEAFYHEKDLCIVLLKSGNEISAIAPLALKKQRGVERLELLGISFLYEPGSVLYGSEDSLTMLLAALLKLKRPVHLQRVPADSPVVPLFSKLAKHHGLIIDRKTSDSASVLIDGDWDTYYNSLSPQRRYDFRRARKRTEQHGQVTCKIFCPKPDELEQSLNEAFQVEAKGWKGRDRSALLCNEKMQTFFRKYAALACRDYMLRLCFFYVNDSLAAMQIAVEYKGGFWVLKIGYDEMWSNCSPGMQLTMESIRYAFEQGLNRYEFLGSDESWLHIWARHLHTYRSLGFYPFAFSGLCGLGIDVADYAVRRLRAQ